MPKWHDITERADGGLGEKGRTGGFVSLSSEDVAKIYKIAAKATV